MPTFQPKTISDPSNLTHGRHPGFLLAITEEAIPEGWAMGTKDTLMFRWHLAVWEHESHLAQYAPEQQSAISSRAFSPKGKYQASKAWVWACSLIGRELPKGQGVDLDPLLPLACYVDVERVPGNDYCKIVALWGRPEGQAAIPPVVQQLRAQYATGLPAAQPAQANGHAAPPPAPQPPPPQWGTPGPAAPPSSVPGGWPGAAQPARTAQAPPPAQPTLPGTAPRGAQAGIPF